MPLNVRHRKIQKAVITTRKKYSDGEYFEVDNDHDVENIDDGLFYDEDPEDDDDAGHFEGKSLVSNSARSRRSGFSSRSSSSGSLEDLNDENECTATFWRYIGYTILSIMFAIVFVVALLPKRHRTHIINSTDAGRNYYDTSSNKTRIVEYECPISNEDHEQYNQRADNFENTSVIENYKKNTKLVAQNVSKFIEEFRDSDFDGWGKSYTEVKAGMYHWKARHYPTNLKNGDSIFESACGLGLNLIMTLEIIQEVTTNSTISSLLLPELTANNTLSYKSNTVNNNFHWDSNGISDLVIYGNEYIPESANASNEILDRMLPSLNATKGSICVADSTNLHFIPSNSFDLVFTGYISTILDPLHFDKSGGKSTDTGLEDVYTEFYEKICDTKDEDWKSAKLTEIAQQKQNDWFGKWVNEMIRIAKPGKPIIIEQVSLPFCDAYFDWGGVSLDFWSSGIENYNWDIDINTLEIEDDRVFRDRYHVFMRKAT